MRVYRNVPVELTYQNFGSTWLCILRGAEQNIDKVFNGLFNFGATNGDYQFYDGAKTVAYFWSNEKSMRRFFFYQYFVPRFNIEVRCDLKTMRRAMRWAKACIGRLKLRHEAFRTTANVDTTEYSIGRIRAENPDTDFRDAVLTYAFLDSDKMIPDTIDSHWASRKPSIGLPIQRLNEQA